jgi:outer membrane biosynthesis protein TonB
VNDNSNKRAGIIGTVIFHLLLLLFFLTTGLTQPDPLPEQESASIVLGWTDAGSGDDTPSPTTDAEPEDVPKPAEPEPTPVEEAQSEEVETQEDSPVAVKKPVETTKPKTDKPKVEEPPKETAEEIAQREKAERIRKLMGKPAGGGKGDDEKPGSVGKEDGEVDGKGVFGTGGNSWSLIGRSFKGGAIVTEKPKEEGIIVIDIVVGTNGKVLRADYNSLKSKSISMHLISLAKKAARNAKFNVDPSANVQQKGELTFNFKLK